MATSIPVQTGPVQTGISAIPDVGGGLEVGCHCGDGSDMPGAFGGSGLRGAAALGWYQ